MRGYHVYKDTWATAVGEELPCQHENGNRADFFAVAVVRGEAIVGHVPKRISSVCSLYLRWDGLIVCRVTGSRGFSGDLVQGHLFTFDLKLFSAPHARIKILTSSKFRT